MEPAPRAFPIRPRSRINTADRATPFRPRRRPPMRTSTPQAQAAATPYGSLSGSRSTSAAGDYTSAGTTGPYANPVRSTPQYGATSSPYGASTTPYGDPASPYGSPASNSSGTYGGTANPTTPRRPLRRRILTAALRRPIAARPTVTAARPTAMVRPAQPRPRPTLTAVKPPIAMAAANRGLGLWRDSRRQRLRHCRDVSLWKCGSLRQFDAELPQRRQRRFADRGGLWLPAAAGTTGGAATSPYGAGSLPPSTSSYPSTTPGSTSGAASYDPYAPPTSQAPPRRRWAAPTLRRQPTARPVLRRSRRSAAGRLLGHQPRRHRLSDFAELAPATAPYTPGNTGYAPPSPSSYRSPSDPYAPLSPSSDQATPYRPGSTSSYAPQSSGATTPSTAAAGYPSSMPPIGSGVSPAGYSQPTTGSSYR